MKDVLNVLEFFRPFETENCRAAGSKRASKKAAGKSIKLDWDSFEANIRPLLVSGTDLLQVWVETDDS